MHEHDTWVPRPRVITASLHVLNCVLTVIAACSIVSVAVYSLATRSRRCSLLQTFHRQALIAAEEEQKQHHPRISYRQLVEATGCFVASNQVGEGRFGHVYKGTLRDDTRVAVKVLDPRCGVEVSGSFKREYQVLKRTRHRNLIRVITACSKPDFKALVLPLMPNGSLENYLYPPNNDDSSTPGLDLHHLVNILSDVAPGVAYLHHYAPFKVVHCDLKPSNILLDEDMTAIVSDFGISKLMKEVNEGSANLESSTYNSITGVLLQGSVGYIAPGQPSTQGDVYSFGVLLPEMITGRRPTDVMFHEGLTLHDWVKSHYPHDMEAITAQGPLRNPPLLSESACGRKARRPTMADVAQEIDLLKQDLGRRGGEEDRLDDSCSTPTSSF